MRYDFRNIINRFYLLAGVFLLMCLLSLIGCRAKKDSSRHESYVMGSERTERRTDSIRTLEVVEERSERSGSEVERQYTRTTEYDTTGRVQAVSETWRDRRLSNVSSEERDARTVSVAGMSVDIIERDTSTTIISEVVKVDTDSRPIQGAEWFWIILSSILIATVIIYIIYNRIK